MASETIVVSLERRITQFAAIGTLVLMVAAFAGILLTHHNTTAIVDPLVRWISPSATSGEVERIHQQARKFGHFLIPAGAFAILVIGPLRRRPLTALALCALFAATDELLQAFNPARTGSILDVILDISGAVFAYFLFCGIRAARTVPVPAGRTQRPISKSPF